MKERDFNTPKDIIAYFVSKLNAWINVAGVEACGENQYKILTCNTKWAQRGFEISGIGKIIEVDFNNYIKVESETEPENQNFELYEVKFIHGTTVQVNAEVSRSEFCDNPFKRLPVVYLKEFTELERKTKYSQDLIRVNLPLELHFLTIGNHTDWTTKDAYNEAIYPMLGLCNAFQEVLFKEKAFVGEWEEENLEFAPKFGVRYNFDKGNGVEKNYFDDELSGVSAKFDLPLKMNFCKSCKEGEPPLPKFTLFVNEEEFGIFEGNSGNLNVVNKNLGAVGEKVNSNFVVRNLFERRHDYQEPYSYCGVANDGTLESSTGWKITRIEIKDGGEVETGVANGKWTDRNTLIYT